MEIGYCRVSTSGQSLDSQLEELGRAGCAKIYSETASGARSDRPQLHSLLRGPGTGQYLGGHTLGSTGSIHNRSADHHQGKLPTKIVSLNPWLTPGATQPPQVVD